MADRVTQGRRLGQGPLRSTRGDGGAREKTECCRVMADRALHTCAVMAWLGFQLSALAPLHRSGRKQLKWERPPPPPGSADPQTDTDKAEWGRTRDALSSGEPSLSPPVEHKHPGTRRRLVLFSSSTCSEVKSFVRKLRWTDLTSVPCVRRHECCQRIAWPGVPGRRGGGGPSERACPLHRGCS